MKIEISKDNVYVIARRLEEYYRIRNEIEYKYFSFKGESSHLKEDVINEMVLDYTNRYDRVFSYFIQRSWFLVVEKIDNSKENKYYISDKNTCN